MCARGPQASSAALLPGAPSELKASAAEFVPWDPPLLSLPSDLSVSPVALMGELHHGLPGSLPITPRVRPAGEDQDLPPQALVAGQSSGEEHFDVVNRLLQ